MFTKNKKTALVTGGAIRVGRQVCMQLARAGWQIIVHYNNSLAQSQELVNNINHHGGAAIAVQADFTRIEPSSIEPSSIIPSLNEKIGPIDLLINNASLFQNDNIKNFTRASWQNHFDIHLYTPMLLIKDFITQANNFARENLNIINILDYIVTKPPHHKFLNYSLSKTAMLNLTKILAVDLAPNIRVNAIAPGSILANDKQSAKQFLASCDDSPLKLGGSVEEVCKTIEFILSCPSITGQLFFIDGGRHLTDGQYI